MTATLADSGKWSPRRLWTVIAIVFAFQVACVFWLGARKPVAARRSGGASIVFLAASGADEIPLAEPALFVLPHRYGFSGGAWLRAPERRLNSVDWKGPVGWLSLTSAPTGNSLPEFAATNSFVSFQLAAKPAPEFTMPRLPIAMPGPTNSTLRIVGPLAARRLLTVPPLPVWAHTNILTNTVVQVLADARGNVFSWTLMPPGSGLAAADEEAIRFARTARFEPLDRAGQNQLQAELTMGKLVFQWTTAPAAQSGTLLAPP